MQLCKQRADSQIINLGSFRVASLHCSGYSDSSDSAPLESKTETETCPRSAELS